MGDEDLYIMSDVKNRWARDDSVAFSYDSPWLIVCALLDWPVMHKRVHKHAHVNKRLCLHAFL